MRGVKGWPSASREFQVEQHLPEVHRTPRRNVWLPVCESDSLFLSGNPHRPCVVIVETELHNGRSPRGKGR